MAGLQRKGVAPLFANEFGGGAGADARLVLELEERARDASEIGQLAEVLLIQTLPRLATEGAKRAQALLVHDNGGARIEAELPSCGETVVGRRVQNDERRGIGNSVRGKAERTGNGIRAVPAGKVLAFGIHENEKADRCVEEPRSEPGQAVEIRIGRSAWHIEVAQRLQTPPPHYALPHPPGQRATLGCHRKPQASS